MLIEAGCTALDEALECCVEVWGFGLVHGEGGDWCAGSSLAVVFRAACGAACCGSDFALLQQLLELAAEDGEG